LKNRQSCVFPCIGPGNDDSIHEFQEGRIVGTRGDSNLRDVAVRKRQSLGHYTDRTSDMILSCDVKVLVSPKHTAANLLDRANKAFGIALKNAEAFAVFTLPCQVSMKTRESWVLAQLGEFHLVEGPHRATGHVASPVQVGDEFIVGITEFQDFISAFDFGAERQREVAFRKEDSCAVFYNEGVSNTCCISPEFDFRTGLIRHRNKGNSFFSDAFDPGHGDVACSCVDQHLAKITEQNLHSPS